MADGGITQVASLGELFLTQPGFLSKKLDAEAYIFQKLGFIVFVTLFLIDGGHPFAKSL